MRSQEDKATLGWWEQRWADAVLPPAANPSDRSWRNYYTRRVWRFMRPYLERGGKIIEIGCGNSPWLEYFHSCGLDVWGIDYSPNGCQQARALLHRAGVDKPDIYCADMFKPPPPLLHVFDVVVSFGVMEHFTGTANAISAAAQFLKRGGTLLTFIPNQTGLHGWLQKRLNPEVYAKHVPLSLEQLVDAHYKAGLTVKHAEHVCTLQFGILDVPQPWLMKLGSRATHVLGMLHEVGLPLATKRFSSYLGVAAT